MFDPEKWALEQRWSWLKICSVAEFGLDKASARALVICFGPVAPRLMTVWCESKVVGTCAMAGWEWNLRLDEHAATPE